MHSLLVLGIEVVEAEINGRADSAALNHRAVIRGGEISHNNPTPPPIIFNNNHGHLNPTGSDDGSPTNINNLLNLLSATTTNNNTITSDVNEFIAHHRRLMPR